MKRYKDLTEEQRDKAVTLFKERYTSLFASGLIEGAYSVTPDALEDFAVMGAEMAYYAEGNDVVINEVADL